VTRDVTLLHPHSGDRHEGWRATVRAHRQEVRAYDGKDPITFYLEDVILHGTPEDVADQIRALQADAGMTYLMAAPLSRRSFALLTDQVLPRIAG